VVENFGSIYAMWLKKDKICDIIFYIQKFAVETHANVIVVELMRQNQKDKAIKHI
jgi:hypothetical protein